VPFQPLSRPAAAGDGSGSVAAVRLRFGRRALAAAGWPSPLHRG